MMRIRTFFFCLAACAAMSLNVQAANIFWNATVPGSDFSLSSNWNPAAFPTATDQNRIENGVDATVATAPTVTYNELWIGSTTAEATSPGVGVLNQSDFTLNVASWIEIGEGFTDTTRDNVPGGTGTLNLSGSATFNHITTGNFQIGEAASGAITTGTVNLSGNAVLNNANRFIVGNGASGVGYLNISGNATLTLANDFNYLGFLSGTGTCTMTGGTIDNTAGGYFCVGGYSGGNGTMNMNGGTLKSAPTPLTLGDGAGSRGNFYLNGGIVNTTGVVAGVSWDSGDAIGNFYFNGGTLKAAGGSSNFMTTANSTAQLNVYVQSGGAIIDTAGYNITISNYWQEDPTSTGGGLTKNGSGTLNFTAALPITGAIAVNGGALYINNGGLPASTALSVVSGATFGGAFDFSGSVTANAGAILAPGKNPAGTTNAGTMRGNAGSVLNLNGNSLNFVINSPGSSSLIDVSTGVVNVRGVNYFYFTQESPGSTTAGDYPLFKAGTLNYLDVGGNFATNFKLQNPNLGIYDASITTGADPSNPLITDIFLHLATSNNYWVGASGGTWTNTANWHSGAYPSATGAKALFGTNGTPPTVVLDKTVSLGKLVFDNSSGSYTITNTGTNTFRINLNAGTGVPAEVDDLNGSHTVNVGITLNKDTLFYVANSGETLTVSGSLLGLASNSGVITKDGSGTLWLSAATNTFGSTPPYVGSVNVVAGTLQVDGTCAYTGPTTVSNATLIAKVIANTSTVSSIGAPTSTAASNLVLDTATLKYTGAAAATTNRGITLANAVTIDTAQNLTFSGGLTRGSPSDMTITTPGAGIVTLGGAITDTATAPRLYKAGTGTLVLAPPSGWTGMLGQGLYNPGVIINDGTLKIAAADNTATFTVPNGNVIVGGNVTTDAAVMTLQTGTLNLLNGEFSVGGTSPSPATPQPINQPATFNLQGGTLYISGWMSLGRGNNNTSTMNLSSGTVSTNNMSIGFDGGVTGFAGTQVLNLSGTAVLTSRSTSTVDENYVGESSGSNATLNISDTAQLNTSTWLVLGRNSGSTGTVYQYGGAFTTASDLRIGAAGTGTYNQTGGTVTGLYLRCGMASTATGQYNLTGGSASFTGTEADLGSIGTASLNVGGTGTIALPALYLGMSQWSAAGGTEGGGTGSLRVYGSGSVTVNGVITGTNLTDAVTNPATPVIGHANIDLDGGMLTTNGIVKSTVFTGTGGLMTVNFNSGVLKAGAADNPTGSVWFLSGIDAANVKTGGAIIDTNGFNVTVNQILAADTTNTGGGLTKQGTGTLTIAQQATYTGNTTVSVGTLDTLNINTPLATVSVGSSAQLTATSIVANTVTLSPGATLTIKAIAGGPSAGLGSITPIPEPGTMALMAMAILTSIIFVWRKKM